jgi:hypothetical protein
LSLFLESYFLSQLIVQHVISQDYFSIPTAYSLKVIGMMLLLLYTFSLSVGAWDTWEQYVLVPTPIVLAVFLSLLTYSLNYALIVSLLFSLILVYDIHKSTHLRNLLIRFQPRMILRLSLKGVLFIFAILGSVLVILHSAHVEQEFNLGNKIADLVKEPVKHAVDKQLKDQLNEVAPGLQYSGYDIDFENIDPAYKPLVESLGLEEMLNEGSTELPSLEVDVEGIVENQVNSFIEPYKNLIQPIMALLSFALFQFYATITFVLFVLTVDVLFWIAKHTKFFEIENVEVIQEKLRF